jgi:hypothetical protein
MESKALGERRVQSSRFKVQGSRFKVQGSRFKVQGSRFKVQGSKFKVEEEERCKIKMQDGHRGPPHQNQS